MEAKKHPLPEFNYSTMALTSFLLTLVLAVFWTSPVLSAPNLSFNQRASIGILPVITCPDDTDYPQVIVSPSLAGQELAANQYVVCFRGKPLIFNCSEGLFFNWSTMSCDFPYERSGQQAPNNDNASPIGDLDLIPVGPVPVPISPQYPVPIWTRRGAHGVYPYPITKPDPSVIMPIPVLPAHPPPYIPRPVPYYY